MGYLSQSPRFVLKRLPCLLKSVRESVGPADQRPITASAAVLMGDDGWGAASDNWTGHSVSPAQNVLREEGPPRTAEVTARCMVELYELQSGILDREQQVAQPFIDQVFYSCAPFPLPALI
jgi:hypothetical protein